MESIPIIQGWEVHHAAPTLMILDGEGIIRFETDQWNPNMSDPTADALAWASAVADPHSGLTVDDNDDQEFAAGVVYVRTHAPEGFADECSILSEEAEEAAAS